jgi:hypothetical protein
MISEDKAHTCLKHDKEEQLELDGLDLNKSTNGSVPG